MSHHKANIKNIRVKRITFTFALICTSNLKLIFNLVILNGVHVFLINRYIYVTFLKNFIYA